MSDVIKINCEGAATVDWRKLQEFQGDLKHLTEDAFFKLRKSIIVNGVISPFFVWKNKRKLWTIDGHQRLRVFPTLEEDGFVVPDMPVVWVKAKDEKEAAERILILNAKFGQMTRESLYEFIETKGLDGLDLMQKIDMPGIDSASFVSEFYKDDPPPPPPDPAGGAGAVNPDDFSQVELTEEEVKAIQKLKKLGEQWPIMLVIFQDEAGLTVRKADENNSYGPERIAAEIEGLLFKSELRGR